MARPKKDAAASAAGKSVMVNFGDYLNMQTFLAQHLQVQHSMASRIHAAASSQLGAVTATMRAVQNNTRNALQMSGIDESSINQITHGAIYQLLQMDETMLAEPPVAADLQLPAPPVLTKVKARKQRRPKDPNAPKRPVTAFFLYLAEHKDSMAKELGPDAKPGQIQQRNKDMWNSLSEAQQEKYKEKYREHFEAYRSAMQAYQAQGNKIDPGLLQPDVDGVAAPDAEGEDDEEEDAEGSDDDEDDSSDASPEPAPQPAKRGKGAKAAAAPAPATAPAPAPKEPEKKKGGKKAAKVEKDKSTSPEVSKKKRKADAVAPEPAAEAAGAKKKKRKSAGYAGNADDY